METKQYFIIDTKKKTEQKNIPPNRNFNWNNFNYLPEYALYV